MVTRFLFTTLAAIVFLFAATTEAQEAAESADDAPSSVPAEESVEVGSTEAELSGDETSEEANEPIDEETSEVSEEPTAEELRMLEEAMAEDEASQKGDDEDTTIATPVAGAVQSLNPDISLILDVAGGYFRGEPMQVGAHDPNRTGFTLQQLEMSVSANVDPYFAFASNLVFAEFGVEVEEAYVTTLALPANLQIRAGQFLTRFGRLNNTHPHSWSFLDQPIVNGKFFGGEGSRGLGAELSWLSPLPWYVELVGSANNAAGECCARSFYGGEDLGVETPEDLLYTTALKQFFPLSDDWSLFWGMSAQFGPNPTGLDNRSEIYGTDLYLRWRPRDSVHRTAVSLTVEAMMRQRQVPDDVLRDWGGYSQLIWNIDPQWEVGARHEWVAGVQNDPLDPEWTDDRFRYAGQLTYYPSHFSRLRFQASMDDPQWLEQPIFAAILGLEVTTGAHGAHKY